MSSIRNTITFLLFILTLGFLAGCAIPAKTINLSTDFNLSQAEELLKPGSNTIEGSALIRQKGGDIVTCAGVEVALIPVTDYATERMVAIYGSDQKGYRSSGNLKFEPDLPEYYEATKRVLGDAQGEFVFSDVTDGEFYISTRITWTVGYSSQGGVLMKRVKVEGGETERVVLSP